MRDSLKNACLIHALAQQLEGSPRVAVGTLSPFACAAAFLARELGLGVEHISVLGSLGHNDFTEGGRELFDRAAQGRIDAFFLGGGQIDGSANINLVGTGAYPSGPTRFPGSFGSSYLYFLIPKVVLFSPEHSRRTLVERVDFISAPGTSQAHVYRPGGPAALVTGRCVFDFDRAKGRFVLSSTHPWSSPSDVRASTGFDYLELPGLCRTALPDERIVELVSRIVRDRIAETYPTFARRFAGD